MLEQAINTRAHVSSLKERRCDLADHGVGGTDASLQICSYDLLAGCVGQRWAIGEALCKSSRLSLKVVVGNNSVHDIPSLEGRGIVLIGAVDDFAGAIRAGPLGRTLNAAKQRGRPNRCLDLPEAGRGSRPYEIRQARASSSPAAMQAPCAAAMVGNGNKTLLPVVFSVD